jgi:hypothetical protein
MPTLTPKQLAAQSRRNIDTAIKSLRAVADRYGEVDEYIVTEAYRLAEDLAAFAAEINDALAAAEI